MEGLHQFSDEEILAYHNHGTDSDDVALRGKRGDGRADYDCGYCGHAEFEDITLVLEDMDDVADEEELN